MGGTAGRGGSTELHEWERGFCASLYAPTVAALIKEVSARRAETPIQRVFIGSAAGDIRKLLDWPLLARMRSLTLWGNCSDKVIGDAGVTLLADCPKLARIEELDLLQNAIGPEGVAAIARSSNLPALRDLRLYGNDYGDEGVRVLAGSPLAGRLRTLSAGGSGAVNGPQIVAATRAFANLQILNWHCTPTGDAGARALAKAAHLAGLTELGLHACGIRDPGVRALANSPHLANLETLDLSENENISLAGAAALAESPYLKRIRRLDLWRCEWLSRDDQHMLRKRFRSRVTFGR